MKKIILIFFGIMLSASLYAESDSRTVNLNVTKDTSLAMSLKMYAQAGVISPGNPNPTTIMSFSGPDGNSGSVTNSSQYSEKSVSANIYDDTSPTTMLTYIDDPGQGELYPSINGTAVIKDTSKKYNNDICRINFIHAFNDNNHNYVQVIIHNTGDASAPYCQFEPADGIGNVALCNTSSCSFKVRVENRSV